MDTLASFVHLTDNMPLWLSKLETLSAQVAGQHAKFSQLTAATEIKLARRKTGSTESLRPDQDKTSKVDGQDQTAQQPASVPNPESATDNIVNDVLAIKEARRKRKPGSALSADSGPQKYRTRTIVIVYYDSAIQDAFEQLVRHIAGARNNLRKGRAAAIFKSRMASLAMGSPMFSTGGEQPLDLKFPRPTKSPLQKSDNTSSAFERIDKDLETAQISCEKAAHQMLRDGDCKEELLVTKCSFQNSLQLAEKEVERLRAEETEQAVEVQAGDKPMLITVEEKNAPPTPPTLPITKTLEYTRVGAIEVDDGSDAESVHVDLSLIRRRRV